MSITPRGMSVQEAYRLYRDNKLLVNRKYQRKLVWTLKEKQHLIDSLIKDYPIPLILLAETSDEGSSVFEIMDGMQRLNAIFSFIENGYSVDGEFFDINEFTRAKQAGEVGLFEPVNRTEVDFVSPEVCADILDYQLAVTLFPMENDSQVTDVFGRINSGGRQLSAQEKRQAGMVDDFSLVVRELASEIRGDSSRDRLSLSEMPEISIDSNRVNLGYSLRAEEIFWCKQGILWVKQLRDSEDEEMLLDICASLVGGVPIARSKDLFDRIYNEEESDYVDVRRNYQTYGAERLKSEVKVTLSVLRETIDGYGVVDSSLKDIVNPTSRNPIKASFFAIFMAFHKLIIVEEKTPDSYESIMDALVGLQKKMVQGAKFATVKDRVANINTTIGLIQNYFIKKDPPMLKHGARLALDMENSLRRSRIETARYECKQGFIDLSDRRDLDESLPEKIINTICGIANSGPDADGYIFIGVADSESDAKRVEELDGITSVKVGQRYVVGINREVDHLQINDEQYLAKITGFVKNSELSDILKNQVLSQIDFVEYKGFSVIRIRIPKQKELSFVGDSVYLREGSSTVEASGKKLIAANNLFN